MDKAPTKLQRFVCSALIGGMLLAFGGVAGASELQKSSSGKDSNTITTCPQHSKHKAFNSEKMKNLMQKKIAKLVESGDLSQAKADKVVEYYYKTAIARKAQWQKAKAMQPEERREYIKQLKNNRKKPLVELVKDGVITQQEADLIAKVMPKRGHYHKKNN